MQSIMQYGRRIAAVTTAAALLALGACSESTPVSVDPELPANPPIPAEFRGAAFLMDVDAVDKTVRVSAPTSSIDGPVAGARLNLGVNPFAQYSLLGGDVVDLSVSNFSAGAVGAVVPGKVLITFDMTINNKLDGIRLITPTFPTPPAGVTGLQAFPFEISVTTTSGGVTSGGNEVVVTSPRFGEVIPSDNWDGDFHNFFNDAACTVTDNDCFRYESFGQIEPLGSSTTQEVGFLIDPTVGDFRVKILLAADLENGVAPTPGTVAGNVSSNEIGALSGVTVNVSGGFSGATDGSGDYSIANVATGSRTVSVTNLPSGCITPASQSVTVATGATTTVDFVVTCAVPVGSISGLVTSSLGGGLAGVGVIATPTGGAATPAATTAATGSYSIANVPALSATGELTLTNLPANCTNPGPVAYAGFTTAGLTGQNIVVTCTPPPVSYPVTASWGPVSGGFADLTLAIDMGSEQAASISFNIGYNGTVLDYTSNSGLSPNLNTALVNEIAEGTAGAATAGSVLSFSGGLQGGNFTFIVLRYAVAPGFSGSITPTITITELLEGAGLTDITSSVPPITAPTLTVP